MTVTCSPDTSLCSRCWHEHSPWRCHSKEVQTGRAAWISETADTREAPPLVIQADITNPYSHAWVPVTCRQLAPPPRVRAMIRHALSLVTSLTSSPPTCQAQGSGIYNTVDNYSSNESSYQGAPWLNKSKQNEGRFHRTEWLRLPFVIDSCERSLLSPPSIYKGCLLSMAFSNFPCQMKINVRWANSLQIAVENILKNPRNARPFSLP